MKRGSGIRNARDVRDAASDAGRVLVLALDPAVATWIEDELEGQKLMVQTARSVDDVIAALIDDPPPRPQLMIVDLDPIAGADVFRLHAIRERGWFGAIIALGTVPDELKASLNIEIVIAPPLADSALRAAVNKLGLQRSTMRLETLRRGTPPRHS